jgi:hypothetical protein
VPDLPQQIQKRSKTMRNEVIYDKNGRPDIMVVFTPSELGLPDTLRGRKVKEYAISKYPNTLIDGVPYSLPFMKPAVNISHDEAIRLCESKGEGWHLITNDEWVALGFWSWDNDTMPTGNTASGKSHSHPEQTGTTYEGGCSKTLTGSGPVQWNHDGTAYGVADMCGNIWEHVGGVRFMDGMPQVIPNNGAAYGADQSKDSTEWEAIYTEDGDPVYYNVHGGEITLQPVHPDGTDYDGVKFTDLEVRSDMDVPDKLKDLGLYPADGYESDEYFWLDSDGERVIYRGGPWNYGALAGVFCLHGYGSRGDATLTLWTIWTLTRSSQNRKSAAFWLRILSAGSSRCSPGSFRSSTKLHTERIRKASPNWPKRQQPKNSPRPQRSAPRWLR